MAPRQCFLCALIGITTAAILILPTLVLIWREFRKTETESEFCYSIKDFSNGNPDLLRQLIVLNDKNTGRNKNCGKLSYILEKIVKQKIVASYNSDSCPEYVPLNLDDFNCKALHEDEVKLHLDHIASHARPVPGRTTKVMWKSTTSSVGKRLKHLPEEGAVLILMPGMYYISSLLTIRVQNSNATFDHHDQTIRHVVYMISYKEGSERILLEHVRSMCEMAVEHAHWTSKIGAAFHLEEHDKIYVTTSHPYNLVSGPGKLPTEYVPGRQGKCRYVATCKKCKTFNDRGFCTIGPKLWNKLPLALRES